MPAEVVIAEAEAAQAQAKQGMVIKKASGPPSALEAAAAEIAKVDPIGALMSLGGNKHPPGHPQGPPAGEESKKIVVKSLKRSEKVVKDKNGKETTVTVEEEVEEEVWVPANRDYSEFMVPLGPRAAVVIDHTYDHKYDGTQQQTQDAGKPKKLSAKEIALQQLLAAEAEAAEAKKFEEARKKKQAEREAAEAKAAAEAEEAGRPRSNSYGPTHWREKQKRAQARRLRNNNNNDKIYFRNRIIRLAIV